MSNIRVVLVSPRNPLNIGAAARAMSNFGFTDLRLVNPYDVAFREARSAVRAGYILEQARVHQALAEALDGCSLVVGTTAVGRRDLHLPFYTLETAAPQLRGAGQPALLFGSEKFGLSNEDLSYCHWLLRIPSREEHASMNLGQAVAICLYELVRDGGAPVALHAPLEAADAGNLERITDLLWQALNLSGYVQARTADSSAQKLRRLILRASIPQADAEKWTGMLRQILWRIKREAGGGGDGNPSSPEIPEQTPESGSP